MTDTLTLDLLREVVAGRAAAFRACSTLQPAGGPGTKVFPPTYSGKNHAVYALERRRLPDYAEPVPCVLLDSVQSQANRLEDALQQAVDDGLITLPLVEVDFTAHYDEASAHDATDPTALLDPVGRISTLQTPHRIADAILRDSHYEGQPFRQTAFGRKIERASVRNATVLFDLCPTALLFGMWDSTGPKGGLGAKFERAIVSEIVGINAVLGLKTSSRIDPLGITRGAGPLYELDGGGWTLDASRAKHDDKGKPNVKGKDGLPSGVVHGNIAPSTSEVDKDGEFIAGGVTIDRAEQTVVISLPAIRRLRFPVDDDGEQSERDIAGRMVLVAMGLLAAVLVDASGQNLRSRCLLYGTEDLTWEVLDRAQSRQYVLPVDDAIALYNGAVAAARRAGLPWREEALRLQPSLDLVELVARSQRQTAGSGKDVAGDA